MGDKLDVKLPGSYTITPALEKAATTAADKGFLKRIKGSKAEDMSFDVDTEPFDGKTLTITNAELKKWVEANRGKKIVIPEIRFRFADKSKIFNDGFAKGVEEKAGGGDDYAAKYAVMLMVKGKSEIITGTSKNKISIASPQVQDQ